MKKRAPLKRSISYKGREIYYQNATSLAHAGYKIHGQKMYATTLGQCKKIIDEWARIEMMKEKEKDFGFNF